jgi:diguanylate cyclase (GGDEF)-like protein
VHQPEPRPVGHGLTMAAQTAERDRGVRALVPLGAFADWIAGASRVWLLNGGLAVVAAMTYLLVIRPLPALESPLAPPWWLVALGFAAAEVLVVHLQFRRDTHSFSISEIPLVFGLFFLSPDQLILALLVGSGGALAVHRSQPAVKLAFNLGTLAFTAGLAAMVFRAILGAADPLGPAGWGATFAATISANILGLLLISLAIRLATGTAPEFFKLLGSGAIAAFFNTCLGLVIVTVLWIRPEAAWLPLVLAALMIVAYRIYASVRQKHESLEVLYESTRRLQQSADVDAVIGTFLAQAREMFRAERAEIMLLPTDSGPGLKSSLGPADELESIVLDVADPTEGVWARVASEGRGLSLPRPISNDRLREHFGRRGIRDAMVAPLFSRDLVVGTMLVGNRQSDVSSFGTEDLRLFETFVNHASASLENAFLIANLRRQAEATEHRALHDSLTELPNRTLFRRHLDAAIEAAGWTPNAFAVLLMDLDRFKEVNDTLGHHNGDRLLEAVAARLTGSLRPGDVVARLGGDEFGILLTGSIDRDTAGERAQQILHSLAKPFDVQELTLEVGASIGIALFPEHGIDPDTLIQRADVAMYEAKGSLAGHEIYDPEADSYSPARLALLGDLRSAIEHNRLTVEYQPQVDVADGRIVGAEALVRWRDPRRGLVPPDEFIPIAEHTGLLRPLTLQVLAAALAECSRWRAAGYELSVAVNLSARNLLDAALPADVARLLAESRVPPSALELEITETTLVADLVRTHGVLQRLNEIGVGISIDDFGTGYSSLSYIRRMPVDELKIDKSFVTGMAENENDALIVRSTIELGRNLGLRVVAEGVETLEVWAQLQALGCHVAQGYHFGRPVSADVFLRRLISAAGLVAPSGGSSPLAVPPGSSHIRVLRAANC